MNINGQIILEETFDENYVPLEEELFDYARTIDIDPINEPHLMWIAREGISAPLPKNWKPCQDQHENIYYFNFANGDSVWDHPCDEHYKKLVQSERKKWRFMKESQGESQKIKPTDEKKDKMEKSENNEFRSGGPNANYSVSTPSMNKGRLTLAPMQSRSQLPPLRGSNAPNEMTMKSSLNTTASSTKTAASRSMNMTSSMSVPVYSTEFDDEVEAYSNTKFNANAESQDMSALKFKNEANNQVFAQPETESESEDYGKDVDFGIDKGLSEKIMNIENLEYEVRGSLEKDFEGTLSLKSSGRTEGIGKISPLLGGDVDNDERLIRANLAAAAAERRANLESSKFKSEENEDEEKEKLERKKKEAIEELQKQIDEEIRRTETEMRKEKETKLAKLKKEIEEEEEAEIDELKKEKEQHIKEELDSKLDKMREEISRLHENDQSSLEKEKEILMEDLQNKVKKSIEEEEERLANEKQMQLEKISADYYSELEELKMELHEEHEEKMETLRNELMEKHEKELNELKKTQDKLHEENMKVQQQEMESTNQGRRAIEELEKGLNAVLKQRREDLRQQHQNEIEELKTEYDQIIERMKEDFKEQERMQKTTMEETLSSELEKMKKDHTKQIETLRQDFVHEKITIQAKLEEERNCLAKKSHELDIWRSELERSSNELSRKEMNLKEREQMYKRKEKEIMQEYAITQIPPGSELRDNEHLSDELMEDANLIQQKSDIRITRSEEELEQVNPSMSNIQIDSSLNNATPDNVGKRQSNPCLSAMTTGIKMVNGGLRAAHSPSSFAERNNNTPKNFASFALLQEQRKNLENIITKFDQLESCMHADLTLWRNKQPQAINTIFTRSEEGITNASLDAASQPNFHQQPNMNLEPVDDEDESSSSDDDSYNNLIKLLKNAQSNSQTRPASKQNGKPEVYTPNGISRPDGVSDNQNLLKIIGDLCKIIENGSALPNKQTSAHTNPIDAANALLQSNMQLSDLPNHISNDMSNVNLVHHAYNSKFGSRLEAPKLTPSNFSFQYVPAKELLRDLRRIGNSKPTVSAADWLPEQRNPLPRQEKTPVTNFTQLHTTDLSNFTFTNHINSAPSEPPMSSTPLKRTRPPRLKVDSDNKISIQYPWSSTLHC